MTLTVKRFQGSEITPYIPDLAQLRMKIFRDYPYLYIGNLEYEENYLKTYTQCANSVLVIVFADEKIVGASTAIPLKNEADYVKEPFLAAHLDVDKIFYLGESVLLHEYRGRGIYPLLFKEREAAAKEQGYYITAFCGVERAINHPKRPTDWQPLDPYWKKMGYIKHPELKAQYSWQEIDEDHETLKPMTFWLKQL